MRTPSSKKRTFWVLIFLAVLFVLPILAAHLVYQYGRNYLMTHRTNYGVLLESPLNVKKVQALAVGHGKWQLLYVYLEPTCQKACKKKLFFMKQIQLALGRERERLVNVFVTVSPEALPMREKSLKARLGIYHGQMTLQVLKSFFTQTDYGLVSGFYLVDPLGNLILFYPQNENPNHILKDLKRLLRASRIG